MQLRIGRRSLMVAALAGLMIAGTAKPAHALFMISIEEDGTEISITDDQAGDLDVRPGFINVDVEGFVNPFLVSYQFTSLGAESNGQGLQGPSAFDPAVLNVNGLVSSTVGGPENTLTVLATDNDYLLPTADPKILLSSGSSTFNNAQAGDTRTFRSSFDPDNQMFAETINTPGGTSTATGPQPQSRDINEEPLDLGDHPTPFALTNRTVINLSPSTSTRTRTLGFSGATQVQAIPEPATMAMALAGLPLVGLGAWLRRRKAQA